MSSEIESSSSLSTVLKMLLRANEPVRILFSGDQAQFATQQVSTKKANAQVMEGKVLKVHLITIRTCEEALQDFDVVEVILDITRLSRKQRVSLRGIHFFPSPSQRVPSRPKMQSSEVWKLD
jgi:hypothetical protein